MSYYLATNQRALLQIAFNDANASSVSEGKFARAYELLLSMISNDGTGSAYISESDLATVNLNAFYANWKSTGLDTVDRADWTKVDPGIDNGAWVFLGGVAKVNWGSLNPSGEEDAYSKFIRAYTKKQYEIRFGTPATDAQVQDVSNAIAFNILQEILEEDKGNGKIPDIEIIAVNDAGAAAQFLFGLDEIGGWAGNPFLTTVGHNSSYNQNILVSTGDTYQVLSVIKSVQFAMVSTGAGTAEVIFNVVKNVIPGANDPSIWASLLLDAVSGLERTETNNFIEAAYGENYNLITTSSSKNIVLGTKNSDAAIQGTSGEDLIQGGKGDDVIVGSADDDIIDGGEGADTVDYTATSSALTVNIKNAAQALSSNYIGSVTKAGANIDGLFNVEAIKGTSLNDTFIVHDMKNNLLLDGGAGGEDSLSVFYFPGAVNIDLINKAVTAGTYSISFNNFEKFEGNALNNVFTSNAGVFSFEGRGGTDIVDYSQLGGEDNEEYSIHVVANIDGTITVTKKDENDNVIGVDTLSGIERVIGTSGDDTFDLRDANNTGISFIGGEGIDTYIVDNSTRAKIIEAPIERLASSGGSSGGGSTPIRNVLQTDNPLTPGTSSGRRTGGGIQVDPDDPGTGGGSGGAGGGFYIPQGISHVGAYAVEEFLEGDDPSPPPPPPPPPPGPGDGREGFGHASGYISPLVIDLDGDGIELTALNAAGSVYFDRDGDGFAEAGGWVGGGDGLLAIDANNDGLINHGRELFGTANGHVNGFWALAAHDENQDGFINAQDADFAQLRVWVDANNDGWSNAGELSTLADLAITEIALGYADYNITLEGNKILQQSSATINGASRTVADVYFAIDRMNSTYADDFEFDLDTLDLPNLRGFGKTAALDAAMSQNGPLKTLVEDIAETTFANAFTGEGVVDQVWAILYKWTGVENVAFESRGRTIDAQKLTMLEAFIGEAWRGQQINGNPHGPAGRTLAEAAEHFFVYMYASLLAQTGAAEIFTGQTRYDSVTGLVEGVGGLDLDALDDLEATATLLGSNAEKEIFWQNVVRLIEGTLGTAQLSTGDHDALNAAIETSTASLLTLAQITAGLYPYTSPNLVYGTTSDDTLSGSSLYDQIHAYDGNDTIYGGAGHDQIYGYAGDDTLIGEAGADNLEGGLGNDTYIYNLGDGDDVIVEIGGANDVIKFGPGILPTDVSYEKQGSDNLMISINVAGYEGKIYLPYFFQAPQISVEKVIFDNATEVVLSSLEYPTYGTDGNDYINGSDYFEKDVIEAGAGDDTVNAGTGNDTLIGGRGNDRLIGGTGDDLYVYAVGDGHDTIVEGFNGGVDTLHITGGVTAGDLMIWLDASGSVNIQVGEDPRDVIVIAASYSANATDAAQRLERIIFDDSSELDFRAGLVLGGRGANDTLYGGSGVDVLHGRGGNDTIFGRGGDDTLSGGNGSNVIYGEAGGDTLIAGHDDELRGGEGDDIYKFAPGFSGNIKTQTVNVVENTNADLANSGSDTIRIGGGLTAADLKMWMDSNRYLTVQVGNDSKDTFVIYGSGNALGGDIHQRIERIEFDNGSFIDWTNGLKLLGGGNANAHYTGGTGQDTLIGGSGNDTIFAYGGNDTLNGNGGDDQMYGGLGDDVYIFNPGFGAVNKVNNANVVESKESDFPGSGFDTIRIGGGLTAADLKMWMDSYNHLTVQVGADSKDTFVVYASGSPLGSDLHQRIERIEFDNGSYLDWTNGLKLLGGGSVNAIYTGGVGHDTLIGGLGNDTIFAHGGNDTLNGNGGDDQMYGGLGDDVYIFNPGFGAVNKVNNANVVESTEASFTGSGFDTIRIGGGLTAADLKMWMDSYNHLTIQVGADNNDTFVVYGGGSSLGSDLHQRIERIEFDNGSFIDWTNGLKLLGGRIGNAHYTGGTGDDTLIGGTGNDEVWGHGGNDTLNGMSGGDYLYGGTGSDVYLFSGAASGFGHDQIIDYHSSSAENDTIKIAGVAFSDLAFSQSGSSLLITFASTSASSILIYNQYNYDTAFKIEYLETQGGFLFDLVNMVPVNPPNTAPVAQDDAVSGAYGAAITGNVLANNGAGADSDADNDTLSVVAQTLTTTNGNTVALLANGDFTFTARNGFLGDDTFSYALSDGEGTDTAAVTVTVNAPTGAIVGDANNNILNGNSNNDVLFGLSGNDTLFGQYGNDTLYGGDGDDRLWGDDVGSPNVNDGSDVLFGGAGNDTLWGRGGNDTLEGGAGNDSLLGSDGVDTAVYSANSSGFIVYRVNTNDYMVLDTNQNGLGLDYMNAVEFVQFNDQTLDLAGLNLSIAGAGWGQAATVSGTSGVDSINGTAGADTLLGLEGNDQLFGKYGNDTLYGGDGDDRLWGDDVGSPNVNDGSDVLFGGAGNDTLWGRGGNDTLEGGAGNDSLLGSDGVDTAVYSANSSGFIITRTAVNSYSVRDTNLNSLGLDNLTDVEFVQFNDQTLDLAGLNLTIAGAGWGQAATVSGTSGVDSINGTAGADTLLGLEGNDQLLGVYGNDTLYGGDGDDRLWGDDVGSPNVNDGSDVLFGGAGNDTLWGRGGNDTLEGGAGNDSLLGSDGVDTAVYSANSSGFIITRTAVNSYSVRDTNLNSLGLDNLTDVEFVRFNDQTLELASLNLIANGAAWGSSAPMTGTDGNERIAGYAGGDTLFGLAGNDTLVGNFGDDALYGGDGVDQLWGDVDAAGQTIGGHDTIEGGYGNDSIYGGIGTDTAVYGVNSTYFVITRTGTNTYQINDTNLDSLGVDNLTDIEYVQFNDQTIELAALNLANGSAWGSASPVTGTAGNDYIVGTAGSDTINGADGNDTIYGRAGDDSLYGEAGQDRLYGEAGHDFIIGDEGDDIIYGESNNQPSAADGHDALHGRAGNDSMYGGGGNDYLNGEEGNDIIFGDTTTLNHTNDGNDVLRGGAGNDTLFGGGGNDYLLGGDGVDTLTGHNGADIFIFEAENAFNNIDRIWDFNVSQGDVIDISDLLASYNPATDAIEDFVLIETVSTTSTLKIDQDGTGTTYGFVQIATLSSVTGLTDEAALVASGNLMVA